LFIIGYTKGDQMGRKRNETMRGIRDESDDTQEIQRDVQAQKAHLFRLY